MWTLNDGSLGNDIFYRWAYSLSLAPLPPPSALTSDLIGRHPQRETDTLAPYLLFTIGLLDAGFITAVFDGACT